MTLRLAIEVPQELDLSRSAALEETVKECEYGALY
jgi:hypothetical protein